ncbi:hypothetical protein A9Q86_06695 [Flavobacteriales bacterium 33_180_T64]|nr:hypothetical protein A9Q86_06695 [Flavobacteriales bacterium 33_180_T64]
MGKYFNILNLIIIFSIFFSSEKVSAQLGFCQGNSGDPIFEDNFGTGLQDSPLPLGATTYTYANGIAPDDGLYTVTSNTNYFDWFDVDDRTPDDVNGRMLLVNSDFSVGEFYRTTINGLCENTSYEFSSWIINLTPTGGFCGPGAIPVNVRFEIWDNTDTNLLASGNTGNIGSSVTPNWQQYALVFQTIPSQTSVILKMINNGSGGCGNDLAIDDIVFKSCGDFISVTDTANSTTVSLCSSQTPYSSTLTAMPDNAVFSNHFYQWQESTDGTNWTDILGATNVTLNVSGVTITTYYRAKVAEFATNLNNSDCITFSSSYVVSIDQAPNAPTLECWETATFDDAICNWNVIGTQPTQPTIECWETTIFNNTTCTWDITGVQPLPPVLECWEVATFNTNTCSWDISGTQPAQPNVACWQIAAFNDTTCSWEISGVQPLEPTGLECWQITAFNDALCTWEITGTQPEVPANLECWETTLFNAITCDWEITGTQPESPTNLECWELATFNDTLCTWEITGAQPEAPTNLECWETTLFNATTCDWEIIGAQPEAPTSLECWELVTFNNAICDWEITGTQPEAPTDLECWEIAAFNDTTCVWDISGTQIIDFIEESVILCIGENLSLQASTGIANATYLWNTADTTEFITVSSSGTYTVVTTNGCSIVEKTIFVEQAEVPSIESVQSDGNNIVIYMSNPGDYLYSLDGVNFQLENVFYNVNGGKYEIVVKSLDCDDLVTFNYLHFFIPKFFTPNGDTINEVFSLTGIECYASSQVYIFDRYGKLLFFAKNSSVNWLGTFNGSLLPASDYWYLIIIEGQEFRGHFTLKR